eukprot:scaffold179037_cov37-Tisochrysis_lutea.AAC.5
MAFSTVIHVLFKCCVFSNIQLAAKHHIGHRTSQAPIALCAHPHRGAGTSLPMNEDEGYKATYIQY